MATFEIETLKAMSAADLSRCSPPAVLIASPPSGLPPTPAFLARTYAWLRAAPDRALRDRGIAGLRGLR